ncbi:MAG TPA: DNA repair protein RecO [Eggerthellaceae bacterium]|nr:DNA repair protein RecO [Eggerthellaceae bacterium]
MARSYKARATVLRKMRLGEKDLIVSLIAEDGSLLRAVAKGARKPGGSLAARLELFSTVDALLAEGRNLDVVAEARLAASRRDFDLEQAACAAAVAEMACLVAQEGLAHPRLFDMTNAALDRIADAQPADALAIACAYLLKALASEGVRPELSRCMACGEPIDATEGASRVFVSFESGGGYCERCQRPSDCMPVDAATVGWVNALLRLRFHDIPPLAVPLRASSAILQFARQWTRFHLGRDLKSLNFLLSGGLFE